MPHLRLDPKVAEELELTVEHFNGNHADTVLLLAKYAAGAMQATDAEVLSVDREGVEFGVAAKASPATARLEFVTVVSTVAEIQAQLRSSIGRARNIAGNDLPITSMEREFAVAATLPTHVGEVASVCKLTPNLVEVVLGGGLDGFKSIGRDQFVFVMVGRSGGPPIPAGYSMAEYRGTDPADRPEGAYYTVRDWDPEAQRLTLWIVIHGAGSGVGHWADRCKVGEAVAVWGPREGSGGSERANEYLFITDESGFAAVAVLVGELPTGARATVVAETIDAHHTVDFAGSCTVNTRWVFRGDEEPGTGQRLFETVRSLDPGCQFTVFGAAESRQITAIRNYLRRDLEVPSSQVYLTG